MCPGRRRTAAGRQKRGGDGRPGRPRTGWAEAGTAAEIGEAAAGRLWERDRDGLVLAVFTNGPLAHEDWRPTTYTFRLAHRVYVGVLFY